MAYIKVISMALCLAAASAAPQTLVHSAPAFVPVGPTVFRSAPTFISHAAPATATVVRTAPAAVVVAEAEEEEIDPSYNFGYSVSDIESGDSKTREETRDGDYIKGSYSVADPDGRIRVVEYTADPENGFQATVTYDGAEGPVAIPFNQPEEETVVAAAPAPAATVVAARTAAPAPTFVQAAAPATTFVRTAAPAATFVRTAAPAEAVHAVHNVPAATTVVRAAAAPLVASVPVAHAAFPAATHFTHF